MTLLLDRPSLLPLLAAVLGARGRPAVAAMPLPGEPETPAPGVVPPEPLPEPEDPKELAANFLCRPWRANVRQAKVVQVASIKVTYNRQGSFNVEEFGPIGGRLLQISGTWTLEVESVADRTSKVSYTVTDYQPRKQCDYNNYCTNVPVPNIGASTYTYIDDQTMQDETGLVWRISVF